MECPDFETISLVEEGDLPEPEGWGDHVASCPSCREAWGWLEEARRILERSVRGAAEVSCPPEGVLGRFAEEKLDGMARETVEGHIETCPSCGKDADTAREYASTVEKAGGARNRFRGRSRGYRWGIAAAVLLAAGIAWFQTNGGKEFDARFFGSGSPGVLEGGMTYRPSAPLELREGRISLLLSAGTELKTGVPGRDGRRPLFLERGEVSVVVREGASGVAVHVPGGILRDIGTEFTVSVREAVPPWEEEEGDPVSVTSVRTHSGAVELEGAGRRVQSDPGRRGYLLETGDLFLEEEREERFVDLLVEKRKGMDFAVKRGDRKEALRIWGVLLDRSGGNLTEEAE